MVFKKLAKIGNIYTFIKNANEKTDHGCFPSLSRNVKNVEIKVPTTTT